MPTPSVLVCDPTTTRELLARGAEPHMRSVKLGRRKPVARPLVPRLSAYFRGFQAANPPPASVDYFTKAKDAIAQTYGNDQQGDCVIADEFHSVNAWKANDGDPTVLGTTSEALSEYHRLCGPGDNGCVITNVLDAMKSGGLSVGGQRHKIDGYVAVDPSNGDEVKVGLIVFGALTIGFNVPPQWMGKNAYNGAVWDDPGPFIPVGGHDVPILGYNATGVQVATWGFVVTITWKALANGRIVDEAYAKLSPDWYGSDKLAPNGIDAAALKSDLAKLGAGDLPPWTPDPTPTPTPTPPGPSPTPTPTPTPTPPAPVTPPNYEVTVSGKIPVGFFGQLETVTLTGTATAAKSIPEGLDSVLIAALYDARVQAAMSHHAALGGAVPVNTILQILAAMIPVVMADIQAGKPIGQIVADVVQAILHALSGGS